MIDIAMLHQESPNVAADRFARKSEEESLVLNTFHQADGPAVTASSKPCPYAPYNTTFGASYATDWRDFASSTPVRPDSHRSPLFQPAAALQPPPRSFFVGPDDDDYNTSTTVGGATAPLTMSSLAGRNNDSGILEPSNRPTDLDFAGLDDDTDFDEHDEEDSLDEDDYDRSDSEDEYPFHFEEDDSGHGTVSTEPSLDDESGEHPSELVSLPRAINVGGLSRSLGGRGFLPPPRVRKHKLQFTDFYTLTNDHLGQGAYASVQTAVKKATGQEFAVKLVSKHEAGHTRPRVMREVEIFRMCQGHPNIVQLEEWFEDADYFYLVFEKMHGGPLLAHIQRKTAFTEEEASQVTADIANALRFLHERGIAHRDIKPENLLCVHSDRVVPVKLCDLDLASKPPKNGRRQRRTAFGDLMKPSKATVSRSLPIRCSEPDLASPVGSAEFMAPEVVDTFVGERLKYDKRCDLWGLGCVLYVMLCGYPPFYGSCDNEDCAWNQGEACDDCQESLFRSIQKADYEFPEDWDMVSDEAKDLINHLLVKDVNARYTAEEVLNHPWVVHEAPQLPLQTTNNLLARKDSARDMSIMNENFNVLARFGAAPEGDSASDSLGTPPSPVYLPPTIAANPTQHPLMNMNGSVIYAPTMAPNGPAYVPEVRNGTTYFVPTQPQNPPATTWLREGSADQLSGNMAKLNLETCTNAMHREDSKHDMRAGGARETQVNV
uniref:Protein kinase domain-containing protein n=1 Tax=Panagrellus redivivus TaxID=6233 RepID=A0A7E4VL40_PANRE